MVKVQPGDKFMICSDGLCGFADDDEIFSVVHKVRNNIDRIVDNLIQMANDRGGADNVTVAVLEIIDVNPSDVTEIEPFTLEAEPAATLTAEDEWIERIGRLNDDSDNSSSGNPGHEPESKRGLFVVFAVFVVIAAVILYYATR
jgi:protein phosphatase